MKVPDAIEPAALQKAVEQAFNLNLSVPDATAQGFGDWISLSRVVAPLAMATGTRVLGISGSQGSGKSSLARVLAATLGHGGTSGVACSLDDFYLTRAQREELASQVHPLLRTRGVPGTHDSKWLGEVLKGVRGGQQSVRLPVFDKGLDDRAGTVDVQAEVLILEGWCVGVTPQPEALLSQPCNELERAEDSQGVWRDWVNTQIAQRYQPLWSQIDLWIHLRVPGFAQVVQWRQEQELELPEAQRMSTPELLRFIQHYERLTRWQWRQSAQGPGVVVELDAQHAVRGVTVSAGSDIHVQ